MINQSFNQSLFGQLELVVRQTAQRHKVQAGQQGLNSHSQLSLLNAYILFHFIDFDIAITHLFYDCHVLANETVKSKLHDIINNRLYTVSPKNM